MVRHAGGHRRGPRVWGFRRITRADRAGLQVPGGDAPPGFPPGPEPPGVRANDAGVRTKHVSPRACGGGQGRALLCKCRESGRGSIRTPDRCIRRRGCVSGGDGGPCTGVRRMGCTGGGDGGHAGRGAIRKKPGRLPGLLPRRTECAPIRSGPAPVRGRVPRRSPLRLPRRGRPARRAGRPSQRSRPPPAGTGSPRVPLPAPARPARRGAD